MGKLTEPTNYLLREATTRNAFLQAEESFSRHCTTYSSPRFRYLLVRSIPSGAPAIDRSHVNTLLRNGMTDNPFMPHESIMQQLRQTQYDRQRCQVYRFLKYFYWRCSSFFEKGLKKLINKWTIKNDGNYC